MESNKQKLMKHFASVLRNRALGKETEPAISKTIAYYLSRKELIEILKKKFDGSIPKTHNLVELENEELLELIGDELFIISYVTEKWSREPRQANTKKENTKERLSLQKPKPNDKKDKTTT